jgi:hypothetical protein
MKMVILMFLNLRIKKLKKVIPTKKMMIILVPLIIIIKEIIQLGKN